jgi:NAD(P)-dependent dehydrogenase (short-subunit alcohol dehydrogenase family)
VSATTGIEDKLVSQRFANKVVVVVGGNSGIGLASAKGFAAEGAQVVITGRDRETLQTAAREIGPNTISHRLDVLDCLQIADVFAKLGDKPGRIDALFVAAGVLAIQSIDSVTEGDWDWVHGTNLKGAFFTVRSALPLMSKGSAIVLTSSTAAHSGVARGTVYCSSKAGLRALGQCLAAELVSREIRVNVVSPGPTETTIYPRARGLSLTSLPRVLQDEIDSVPMKRLGAPNEVAEAVLFLASSSSSFITGIDLPVDGGTANM